MKKINYNGKEGYFITKEQFEKLQDFIQKYEEMLHHE